MRRALLLIVLGTALAGCDTAPVQPDPTQVRISDMDARLARVEGVVNNQSLVNMSQRMDRLEMQLRALRGSVDELQNSSSGLGKQQRDLYSDLDKRVAALEAQLKAGAPPVGATGGVSPPGGAAAGNTGADVAAGAGSAGGVAGAAGAGGGTAAPAGAVSDQVAYGQAFDALKGGNYPAAISQFSAFLQNYPDSSLLANAQYWLGQSYFVTRDYDNATKAFTAVGQRWPDSRKAPDALLSLGLTQLAQQHNSDARATLGAVVQRYPDSDAAKLATQQLQKLPAAPNS